MRSWPTAEVRAEHRSASYRLSSRPTLACCRRTCGGNGKQGKMLNIEAFRDPYRRDAIEKDPANLAKIKEEMRVMLGADEIQVDQIHWKAVPKSD